MNYDVIVVGGGVIGVSIAYHLARRQFGRVAVLERAHLGAGSTGMSVASIEPLGRFPCLATLHERSIRAFQNFEAIVGGDSGFTPLPLALFIPERDIPALSEITAYAQAAGSDAQLLHPDEFCALYPEIHVNMDGVAGVYTSQDAGHADPILTLSSYADAAKAMGVSFRQNTPVTGVRVQSGRVVGVDTPQGPMAAPLVVLASGLWIESLLRPLGLTASLYLHRHFVVCVEAPQYAPHLSVIDTVLDFYSRPEKFGHIHLLGGPGSFPECLDPDEAAPGVTMDCSFTYLERLVERFPVMEEARLRASTAYTGIADMTPDKQPLLGHLPVDGLSMAVGLCGFGFKLSPAIGEAMAGLLAGEHEACQLLHPLRPSRIEEGQLLLSSDSTMIF